MVEEYWFHIGEKIKETTFYQEGKMKINQLDRKGFCGHYTKIIHKNNEYVLTYEDHHNQRPKIFCVKSVLRI